MNLNPFNKQLENAEANAKEIRFKFKQVKNDIIWYESTSLSALTNSQNLLDIERNKQTLESGELASEANELQESIRNLSQSIGSLWNPKNWFDSEQSALRDSVNEQKTLHKNINKKITSIQNQIIDIDNKIRDKTQEIDRYNRFDLDAKKRNLEILNTQLSKQELEIERIAEKKKQIDVALAPMVKQINEVINKKSEANSDINVARRLAEELSEADNSYERAMVHQECEEKFGTGNPSKVISKKESEVRRLERDLEKLQKRVKTIVGNAERDIRKLIVDGNNLCYQGDVFIGLQALQSLLPILASEYEVIVVFDASIRRALGSGDTDIRKVLGDDIKVHIVATSVKADETVLDLAGNDKTAYVLSNDRFAEFGEKPVLIDKRVIRHEIVSGQVLIHDLGITEIY